LADEIIYKAGYKIIECKNRLNKMETMDVLFQIRIDDSVCELQMAMKQDATQFHLIHSLYELERSPLGSVFACYLFMTKRVNYSFLTNCQDVIDLLKDSKEERDIKIVESARYILR